MHWHVWGGRLILCCSAVAAQLPKAACLEAFPHLVRLLGAEANVVHSYAAIAIDRLLTQKVRTFHLLTRTAWRSRRGLSSALRDRHCATST